MVGEISTSLLLDLVLLQGVFTVVLLTMMCGLCFYIYFLKKSISKIVSQLFTRDDNLLQDQDDLAFKLANLSRTVSLLEFLLGSTVLNLPSQKIIDKNPSSSKKIPSKNKDSKVTPIFDHISIPNNEDKE